MRPTKVNPGVKNIYVCQNCRRHIITRDVDDGTTPFMISCQATVACPGRMQSSMYHVFDPENLLQHSHEWYRPSAVEIVKPHLADHVKRGGLLLRSVHNAIPGARIVRHKKRGSSYRVIGEGKMQADMWRDVTRAVPWGDDRPWGGVHSVDMEPVMIYEDEAGGFWVRPKDEFEDGRFEDIA